MSEKIKVALALFSLPFLVVWMSWLLTACTFDYREIFGSGVFWFITGCYWFFYVCMIGPILELVNDKS